MNKVSKWQDVSFVMSSNYRKKVLEALDTPKTPSKLSKVLSINISHVSRALAELEGRKMINCLTPETTKSKLYVISNYGKNILQELSRL